jgi:hypothetical protein
MCCLAFQKTSKALHTFPMSGAGSATDGKNLTIGNLKAEGVKREEYSVILKCK